MSFFETLGERVERAKQAVTNDDRGTDDDRSECRSCETRLDEDEKTCPDCGSDDVAAGG